MAGASGASWQDRCRAKGMQPAVFPDGPHKGEPACRYTDASGHPRYAAADLSFAERLGGWWDRKGEQADIALGKVVEARDDALDAIGKTTGLNHGLPGLAGKLLGVPWWVVLGAAAAAAYFVLDRKTR